jgi:hypothetical protein
MRNLFILNGATPMLVADSLMRTSLSGDENVVILEKIDPDFSRVDTTIVDKKNAAPGADMRRAEELLALTLPASKWLTCQYPTEYPNFRRRPAAFLREARRTVDTALALKPFLGGNFDRMFYSGNARLQYALAGSAPYWVRLEHGLGDYMFANRQTGWAARLRRMAIYLASDFREFDPDEIYLADGGQCHSIRNRISGVTRIASPDISTQFTRLLALIASKERALLKALEALHAYADKFRSVIIYLPLDRFPMDGYDHLLDEQLRRVDAVETLFVVKPHPTDPVDYLSMFKSRGLSAVAIDHPVGRYLPVEYIAALLPDAKLMGVGSSALFYAKWWMNREIVYASVGPEIDVGIYRAIHEAFADDIATFGPT